MTAQDKSTDARFLCVTRLLGVLLAMLGRKVAFVHTEPGWRRYLKTGEAAFPNRLTGLLAARGYAVSFQPYRRGPWLRRLWRRSVHIYLGPAEGHRGEGCLTLHPGYVHPYWYLDPDGHRERASIVRRAYDPHGIDPEPANALFGKLRRATVKGGWSTRHQPERGALVLPEDAIVIALQKIPQGKLPPGAVCSEVEMIRAIAAARGARPVLIKYHPFGVHAETAAAVEELVAADPGVHLVDANIHDLLDAAAVVCCFASGAAFEAMLHRVPAVLFATADFHHVCTRAEGVADVPAALARALASKVNYPKYVWWFQTRNMWHADHEDLGPRLDALLEQIGAGP